MKTFWFILSMCLGIFLIIGISMAFAEGEDTDTQTSAVSLTVPHTANLEIANSGSSKTLIQDSDSETDFDAGYTTLDSGKPTLTVSANKNWKLSAKSSGFAANGSYTKATGDLKLKHAGAYVANSFSGFVSLATTDQDIATNATGVWDEIYACQYRIVLDWTKDIPGTYTATVTYTLATQA